MKMLRRAVLLIIVPLLSVALAPPAVADGLGQFCSAKTLEVGPDESEAGDRYFTAQSLDIAGRHDGDLIGLSQFSTIDGVVDGDVFLMGSTLEIRGQVTDSVRYWGQSLTVSGEIDRDLLVGGATIHVPRSGKIHGNLIAFAGQLSLLGDVDGEVKFTGGQVSIGGTIVGNVYLKADEIRFASGARILGDLTYSARKELADEDLSVVDGEVIFTHRDSKKKKTDEETEDEPWITTGKMLWWGWYTLSAMLVGMVAVALGRRFVPALVERVGGETMLGTLIGFGVFLVVPAAALLAVALIVSLPLGFLTLLVFLVAIYLAKLPVAVWLGQRILGAMGSTAPSPFAGLAIGIVILYLLFEIPYAGFILWLVATWLGLGAMILAVRGRAAAAASSGD